MRPVSKSLLNDPFSGTGVRAACELEERLATLGQQLVDVAPELAIKAAVALELAIETREALVMRTLEHLPAAKAYLQEFAASDGNVNRAAVASAAGMPGEALDSETDVLPSLIENDRMMFVAKLVYLLLHSWTPEGVVMWFYRPQRVLDGVAPRQLIADRRCWPELQELAAAGGR